MRPDSLCHDTVNSPVGEGRHQASPELTVTVMRQRRGTGSLENTGQRPRVGCQSQEALLGSDVQDEG